MMHGAQNQCSVITQRGGMGWEVGGRFKSEGTYVCLWLIHADVWHKPTQYCKAINLQWGKKIFLRHIHVVTNGRISFFLMDE